MTKNTKAHLALLSANLFYGAGFTVAKQIMPRLIDPVAFIFVRVSMVTLLFWVFFLGGKSYRTTIEKKDWKFLVLGGLFGVALNQLLFFMGLNITSPIHASLIMLSTPLLITLFAAIALKDKLGWDKLLGLLLGVMGAFILVGDRKTTGNVSASALGDFYIFLNAASYAIYLVMIKPLMLKYRPLIIIRWVFLFGFLFIMPISITQVSDTQWHLFTGNDWLALIFIVVCCTFLTYLWNAYALQKLSPATAGAYIYLQPIFAAVISMLFMGEQMSMIKLLAAILVFSGVYLVNGGWGKKKIETTTPL